MSLKLFAIVIYLFPVLLYSQAFQIDKPAFPIDSLKKVLPGLHNRARVDCLNELARSYLEKVTIVDSDTAMSLAKQAYKEALSLSYNKGLGDACLRFGISNQWCQMDSKEMEKNFREAILWFKKIPDDNRLGHAYLGLGSALQTQSHTDEALIAYKQSVSHFRLAGNRVMLANLLDNIGIVYGANGDFEKYFEYVKNGLKEKSNIHDERGILWSYYNLANIYQSVGDYQTALDYFHLSFQQARSQSIQWNIFRSMGTIFFNLKNYDSSFYYFHKMYKIDPNHAAATVGMGSILLLRKDYNKALSWFNEALTVFSTNGNRKGKTLVLIEISKAYIGLKQFQKALHYANESLTMARQFNEKGSIKDGYEQKWRIYEALMKKDSAYLYFRNFVVIKDSLDDVRKNLENIKKLALYKVEIKEEKQQARIDLLNKDNLIKKQQLQKEALQKKLLTGSLVGFVILSSIIFRNITLKRRNEKHQREIAENELQIQKLESVKTRNALQQQAAQLEMQALRAQMNPHFIFNSLNSINRFILQNNKMLASEYLDKFSRLVRLILQNSQAMVIPLESELESLGLYLELEAVRLGHQFEYKISVEAALDSDLIKVPPLIFQPYAENAIWHGLMNKEEKGHLEIELSGVDDELWCKIRDDGIGRKKAKELRKNSTTNYKSMGMRITADRIALIQDQFNAETCIAIKDLVLADGRAGGTEILLKLPML